MRSLLILSALVLSSQAMALDSVMGLKGRFDYARTESETTPGTTKSSSGVFQTSFLRLVTNAKFNDTTKGKLTLDFQPAAVAEDGVTDLVDEAYLAKSFGALSALIGKQAVMAGGRENDYSNRDLYITSKFKDGIGENVTGLSIGYAMGGQNLYLQYLQQDASEQTPMTDKKVLGLAYYGEFMDKMIMPIISYHKRGTARSGQYDTLGTVGLRVNVAGLLIEADYHMLEQEKLSTLGDAELTSIVGHVRYAHANFQPFAKFIKEEGDKGYAGIRTGATKSERQAWEVGLEYYPNADEDMRYHVVYNNAENELNTPTPASKTEEQKIFAGVAFNYNLLK